MIALWLAAVWLGLLAAGGTPTGRLMRKVLVEAPARALGRIHRGQYLLLLAILLAGAALGWLTDGEAVRMMMLGAPELAGMFASVEIGMFVDVFAVTLVTASTLRVRAAVAHLRGRPIARHPRARRTRGTTKLPANDDDRPAIARAA